MLKKNKTLSTAQVIAVGFLAAVLIGSGLLMLPFAQSGAADISYLDALFTSASSVCVIGLTTVDTFSAWSAFGHIIILVLIQFGGLGIVTFTTSIMLIIGRRVSLRDRLLIEAAFNLDTLSGLVQFLGRVLKWTAITELIGALAYSFVFVPEFGWRGVWVSVFMAVSAFCNSGMDIIGESGIAPYIGSVWVNLVTTVLVITGSIGFIVRWDIWRVTQMVMRREIRPGAAPSRLTLHSKIVLAATAILIVGGAVSIFALEYSNPDTIGSMTLGGKLLACVFQSVNLRSAGFVPFSQKALRDPTALIHIMLMFIGGSPVGTGGGVKTSTVALVVLAAAATAAGRSDSVVFRRSIPASTLRKATGVVTISFGASILALLALLIVSGGDFLDAAFEVFSAIGSAGLSRDYTRTMTVAGKLIIIVCMYLGRVGPTSLAIAFNFRKKRKSVAEYPVGEVTVG